MYCYNCFNEIDTVPCPHCGYDNASNLDKYPTALEAGTVLGGQYILGRVLGQGGFGITYVAFDPKLRQKVAIKEYLPEALCTRTPGTTIAAPFSGEKAENFEYGKQSFLDEARTLAALGNVRGIAAVRTFFDENGTSYFVMDYVEGVSLKAYLKNNGGKIPYEDAERILVPVMDTLATVHSNGVIHRDIAADNIYVTRDDEVKLLDFGAAQYSLGEKSHSFDAVLKPGYTPKEQYMKRSRQGPFTDVYALGATFYASLTGYLPPESLERMENDEIVEPSARGVKLPVHAEEAIMKALEVDAADRFQSMAEFKAALLGEVKITQAAPKAAPQASAAPTPSVQPPESAPKKKAPLVPILASAGGLLVVAAIVLVTSFLLKNNGVPPNDTVTATGGGAIDTAPENSGDNSNVVIAPVQSPNTVITAVPTEPPAEPTVVPEPDIPEAPYNSQVIYVQEDWEGNASMIMYEWRGGDWEYVFYAYCTVGKNGIGYSFQGSTKSYGEGKSVTPYGTFNILFCYGLIRPDTNLKFRAIQSGDIFIDDSNSPYYNTIQNSSYIDAGVSRENTYKQFSDGRYSTNIFFDYNGDGETAYSATPYMGSVYTICGYNGTLKPTAGCIDISTSDMAELLSLLDSSKHPTISISIDYSP